MGVLRVMSLFVMGYGRSGSTLLESLLVRSDSLNAFGEIKYFPERGVIKNEKCSCGVDVQNCEFWKEIKSSLGDWDYEALVKSTNKFESSKFFFLNLLMLKIGIGKNELEYYQRFNFKLLTELSKFGDFIDSSKMPARLYFLHYGQGENYRYKKVYWLVRDPRGVAYSCMKDVKRPEANANDKKNGKMPKFGFVSSIIKWNINYIVSEYVANHFKSITEKLWYEDVVNKKWEFVESDFSPLKHSVSGNPRRFTGGLEQIKVDDIWKSKLSNFQIKLAAILTKPFLRGSKGE